MIISWIFSSHQNKSLSNRQHPFNEGGVLAFLKVNTPMSVEILKYSHFILIKNPPVWLTPILDAFAKFYTQKTFAKGGNSFVKRDDEPVKVFGSITNNEYRFHVNQLPHLLYHFRNNDITSYRLVNQPSVNYAAIKAPVRDGWVAREHQMPFLDYIVSNDHGPSRLISIQTGGGKTFVSLLGISRIGKRTVIIILPTYIEKWCSDITNILKVNSKDIMVVQGSAQLKGLVQMAKDGSFKQPFTIISSRTFQNFINQYESYEREAVIEEYGIRPDELFPLLEVGTLLIDETHQHIHAMFKMLLYAHVDRLIGLTATLISDNYVVEKIHKIMYPPADRMPAPALDKYIDVTAISYRTENPDTKLRTQEWGSNVYSHTAYEKSILGKPHLLSNYLKIIKHLIEISYIRDYVPGDKAIVFAATVAMCDKLTAYFKQHYPDKDVRRYCEQDPYENVIEPDIRFTTIISAGTAIDIPNLRVNILTNSIASSPSNIQVLGRLRKLPDRDVKFFYLFNECIDKQLEYHKRKVELFRDRVRSHNLLRSPINL